MTKITKENTPNKYVRWFVWFLQFRYVWDITTLLEKYLPMEKVYRFLGFLSILAPMVLYDDVCFIQGHRKHGFSSLV